MGLQLIFVVETNKKCKSDWIYIKETIDRFFYVNPAQVKLSPVYLDGKGNYARKEKEIASLVAQYHSTSKENKSQVILCLDCDDYDIEYEDKVFLNTVKQYCVDNSMELIWFCKDIESVYIGKKVSDSEKKEEAVKFKSKGMIKQVDVRKLSIDTYTYNSSNIFKVLERYLDKKV